MTDEIKGLVVFDEVRPWTEYEREELRKFLELTKDSSPEKRERIVFLSCSFYPQEDN